MYTIKNAIVIQMQSIKCFIIAIKVFFHLIIKELMSSFLVGTIAVCKIQYQCKEFATDIAHNAATLYLKIQEEITFPRS